MSTTETKHPLAGNSAQPAKEPQVFNQQDRIVIATPCYGGQVRAEFMASMMDATQNLNARFMHEGRPEIMSVVADFQRLQNESHIDRGRNKLANLFMATPYNWLLFIDSDVVFDAKDVARLWQHGMNGQKLVCGPYALKGVVPQFAVNIVAGTKPTEHGLVDCYHSGTGFMLIHRSVFEAMEAKGIAEEYNLGSNEAKQGGRTTARAYFKSGVREYPEAGKLWLSEDYMFCHEWRTVCGGSVMVDRTIKLGHVGALQFPVNPNEAHAAVQEFRRIKHPDLPPALV